jgi:hypothetical protein
LIRDPLGVREDDKRPLMMLLIWQQLLRLGKRDDNDRHSAPIKFTLD